MDIRRAALGCGALESPYSGELLTESIDLQKFYEKVIIEIVNDISGFSSTRGTGDPLADSNSQGYNDAVEQIVAYFKEKIA